MLGEPVSSLYDTVSFSSIIFRVGGLISWSHSNMHSWLQPQSYIHATYPISVKVACQSTTATDCSHRANSMLLILVEVQTAGTDLSVPMLLILVEVSVKVACWSTISTNCSHWATSMLLFFGGSLCESDLSVHDSHRAITKLLILVEVSVKVACRHRLQPQSYHHATYTSMLLILVEVSVKVACQFTTSTDCIQRAISMLLILVAVSVKVTCQSSTAIDCSHRAIIMQLIPPCYLHNRLLILVEVSVKVSCRSTTATDCSQALTETCRRRRHLQLTRSWLIVKVCSPPSINATASIARWLGFKIINLTMF